MNLPAALLLSLLLTFPPLTEKQQMQLEGASDGSKQLDEPALYALLKHVSDWPRGEEADTLNPNYERIMQNPATYRGKPFLLNGTVNHQGTPWQLDLPGAWGEQMILSVMMVDRKTARSVVVLYADPNGDLADGLPAFGQQATVPAAFYKVWQDETIGGQPMKYLVFVSPGPSQFGGGGAGGAVGGPGALSILALLALLLGGVYYLVRRFKNAGPEPRPLNTRRVAEDDEADDRRAPHRRRRSEQREPESEEEDDEDIADLPTDPIAALEELQRRHSDGALDDKSSADEPQRS